MSAAGAVSGKAAVTKAASATDLRVLIFRSFRSGPRAHAHAGAGLPKPGRSQRMFNGHLTLTLNHVALGRRSSAEIQAPPMPPRVAWLTNGKWGLEKVFRRRLWSVPPP